MNLINQPKCAKLTHFVVANFAPLYSLSLSSAVSVANHGLYFIWLSGTLNDLRLVCVLVTQSCPTLCDPMVCPWNSLGKNTGVGCHSLLQILGLEGT